ncbi:MAG: molybdopterin cofactor-binding domain-containing protein, partial [Steroidobacteraceae bacterium]
MTAAPCNVSRRDLLKVGTGLVVGIAFAPTRALATSIDPAARLPGSLNGNRLLSAWLRINSNGTVTIFTGKVEFGQGIASALAQLAADELDVDYRRIDMVTADTSRTPDESFTAGSQSIEQSGAAIRVACADARQLLLARLGVEAGALTVADGTIAAPGGKHTTYWDVSTDALLGREATLQAKPKAAGEYKLIGRSLARRDIAPKFTGGAAYLQDLRLPGMVHARIGRPPAPRAELISLDDAALKAMPGVIEVVRDGSFVAVVCEREEQAIKARLALRELAVWSRPGLTPTIPESFEHPDLGSAPQDSVVYRKTAPDAPAALRQIEARYTRAFQLHASIGPSCAVAHNVDGRLTV